jgi:hypothetical protein
MEEERLWAVGGIFPPFFNAVRRTKQQPRDRLVTQSRKTNRNRNTINIRRSDGTNCCRHDQRIGQHSYLRQESTKKGNVWNPEDVVLRDADYSCDSLLSQ